jgi:ATP-dependent RNA helicase RhlE
MSFASLGLCAELLSAIATQGFTTPTPIQAAAIPVVFEGCDLLAGAQTGTGKTAAFALPIVQALSATIPGEKRRRPRALVLVPTRELAAQISEQLQNYGRRLSLRSTMIYGGVNIQAQIERLYRGVDMVVATPGRLLDHVERATINLAKIEFLVLDEADRMLDLGFIDDILNLAEYLPAKRQTLLFSATYPPEIQRLADELLNQPRRIEVARRSIVADPVDQTVYVVEQRRKRDLLSQLIFSEKWPQVLVFTRTRYGADKLTAELLFDGLKAAAIHSNKSQSVRNRTLAQFKQGELRVLVATDVAARGLDIERLPYVVNYELPQVAEDYVHRIGRTGRAGEAGVAISLVCPAEQPRLQAIEMLLKKAIPRKMLDGFAPLKLKRVKPAPNLPEAAADQPDKPARHSAKGKAMAKSPAKRGPAKKATGKPVKKQKSLKTRTGGRKKPAATSSAPKGGGRGRRS